MPPLPDPVAPADDEARALARRLLDEARHAALAVIDPATGAPGISRVALTQDTDGAILTLISALAPHTAALRADPRCAVLVGEPGPKGDPLTHPRLMIRAEAAFLDRADPAYPAIRGRYLTRQPKARLYIDFADFSLVRLRPLSALLNGGFARAFRLTPQDLGLGE